LFGLKVLQNNIAAKTMFTEHILPYFLLSLQTDGTDDRGKEGI